jgi:hypothetical protein
VGSRTTSQSISCKSSSTMLCLFGFEQCYVMKCKEDTGPRSARVAQQYYLVQNTLQQSTDKPLLVRNGVRYVIVMPRNDPKHIMMLCLCNVGSMLWLLIEYKIKT